MARNDIAQVIDSVPEESENFRCSGGDLRDLLQASDGVLDKHHLAPNMVLNVTPAQESTHVHPHLCTTKRIPHIHL